MLNIKLALTMTLIHNTLLMNNKDALKLLNKGELKPKTQTNGTVPAPMNGLTCEVPNLRSGFLHLSV